MENKRNKRSKKLTTRQELLVVEELKQGSLSMSTIVEKFKFLTSKSQVARIKKKYNVPDNKHLEKRRKPLPNTRPDEAVASIKEEAKAGKITSEELEQKKDYLFATEIAKMFQLIENREKKIDDKLEYAVQNLIWINEKYSDKVEQFLTVLDSFANILKDSDRVFTSEEKQNLLAGMREVIRRLGDIRQNDLTRITAIREIIKSEAVRVGRAQERERLYHGEKILRYLFISLNVLPLEQYNEVKEAMLHFIPASRVYFDTWERNAVANHLIDLQRQTEANKEAEVTPSYTVENVLQETTQTNQEKENG